MNEEQFLREIGQRIRFLRRGADMTQSDLAKRVGIDSVSFICEIEKGRKQASAFLLHRIEKIIGPVWIEGA